MIVLTLLLLYLIVREEYKMCIRDSPEGTDAPALHQRGYAGKFPDKAGSADGR